MNKARLIYVAVMMLLIAQALMLALGAVTSDLHSTNRSKRKPRRHKFPSVRCNRCGLSPFPRGWIENLKICWTCLRTGDGRNFAAEVEQDPLDGGFVATCLDLPGCYSQGETEGEAVENLTEAIAGVMEARMLRHTAHEADEAGAGGVPPDAKAEHHAHPSPRPREK